MGLTTRRADQADVEAVTGLYLRARRAAALNQSIPQPVHSDEETTAWVASVVIPKLELWLAEESASELVGMLALDGDWIDQLYVDPDLTGHGIGTELLRIAKRERPDRLRLWTFASNSGAQRFYERNGFSEIERTDGSRNEEGAPDIQYAWAPVSSGES